MSWVRFLAQTPTCRQVVDALQQSRQSDTVRSSLNLWIWLGVSAAVTLVQLGQFIPQHIELYRRKSVVGLSAWTLFFGSLYTYMTMIDYLVQSRGQWLHSCTQGWSVCFLELQPFVQVVGSWLLVGLLWFWYLRYEKLDEARELQRSRAGIVFVESSSKPFWISSSRKDSPETTSIRNASTALSPRPDSRGANDLEADTPDPHWWHAVPSEHYRHAHYRHHRYYFDDSAYATAFFRIFCAVAVLVGAPAALLLAPGEIAPTWLQSFFADGCGYLATLLCTVMWIPQIITTYTYGHRGSLSKMWVLFTFISDVVFSAYLDALHVPFSVWANNVPDGFCALFLFVLIHIEERRERENAIVYTSPTTAPTARSEASAVAVTPVDNYGTIHCLASSENQVQ